MHFQSDKLLPGVDVKVENFGLRAESFSTALSTQQPSKVLLFEPTLDFMRAVEVYNAERCMEDGK